MELKIRMAAILAGFALDLCLGDPYGLPHPVRAIGSLIVRLEKKLRALLGSGEGKERTAGVLLLFIVTAAVGGISGIFCEIGSFFGPFTNFLVQMVLCYYVLAARSLYKESMKVCHSLEAGDLGGARRNVSMIVGRDTEALTEPGISRAAVETVAENTSDGVTAPLFYLFLGGPVLAWIYKAVNTMDSMVGYKNERYLYFGRAAARADDIMNFIPARLSALLMIGAAALLLMDAKNAFRIFKRDRFNHKSPNSAQTESVCAGALRIQLAGPAWYFGKKQEKPTIGDPIREIQYNDIRKAGRLMYGTAFLCLLFGVGVYRFFY